MFWNRKSDGLLPPKGIPDAVGRHLVLHQGKNPDWVWNLKAALRPKGDVKDSFEVRVFDQAQAAGKAIKIKNYNTLDECPELILFEGCFNKRTYEVKLEAKTKPA